MSWHAPRRTADLRKGRVSLPGARYFVTCAAVRPCATLVTPACAAAIRAGLDQLINAVDIVPICATIMPDHMHAVFVLTGRLPVGRVMGKFKSLSRVALAAHQAEWQRGFFEHRLRPGERTDPYARYLFLNPYRAGLLPRMAVWPHWMTGSVPIEFQNMLDEGRYPPEEWLEMEPEALGLRPEDIGEL